MHRLLYFVLIILIVGVGITLLAQEIGEEPPILQLSVAGQICDLAIADTDMMEATEEADAEDEEDMEATAEAEPDMEATEEADAEDEEDMEATAEAEPDMEATAEAMDESEAIVITLGEDCDNVIPQLRVARNGTLWIAMSVPDEEEWQQFEALEDAEFESQFDRRGRFVGCSIPVEGEQICSVSWMQDDVTYHIEIPIVVGNAFAVPAAPASSSDTSTDAVSTQEPVSSSGGTGEWGACGSCSTCGANTNVCVTSPDGQCVADPARCDVRPSGSGASSPSSTEDP